MLGLAACVNCDLRLGLGLGSGLGLGACVNCDLRLGLLRVRVSSVCQL